MITRRPETASGPSAALCPKQMVFGPCGGVRPDSGCEVDGRPCPFVADPAHWPGPVPLVPAPEPGSLLALAARRPVVLTDLSVLAYDTRSVAAVADTLAGCNDALLIGEHQNRPDFPPTLMCSLLLARAARPWPTLTCRDRNRLVLEQEFRGLAEIGVEGALCVTGDARAGGIRAGIPQVFDLDGPRLAALAAASGLVAAVPESPAAPPLATRPARVLDKQRAGARLCILNGAPAPRVAEFVAAARSAGSTMPFVAGVPVVTDERSARVLSLFPGLAMDRATTAAVLAAPDPVLAGIDAALASARALLGIDGVVGVNLSGLASGEGEIPAARIKATIGRELLAASA